MRGFYENLIGINPALPCLKFLYFRILRNDYRGTHKLQHYRWSKEYIKIVLKNITTHCDEEGFLYHSAGDIDEDYRYSENEFDFATFLKSVNDKLREVGAGSTKDMVMRKIIFVNLQRMGFLHRFDKHKNLCDVNKKYKNYRYVKITQNGLDFLAAKNLFEEQKILGIALDKIFDGLIQDLMEILIELKYISQDEMTLFVSFLGREYEGQILNKDRIIKFINEFRSLGFRQGVVIDLINDFCQPKNFKGNKTQKRDFHNWKNESQTIFDSLNLLPFFEIDTAKKRIFLREKIANQKIIFKRSSVAKEEYFKNHKIEKDPIFELHHIVPFYFAKDLDELKLIDDWKNLLYIDANSHRLLTHKNTSPALRLSFENEDAILDNFGDFRVKLSFEKNVRYRVSFQKIMQSYNRDLF